MKCGVGIAFHVQKFSGGGVVCFMVSINNAGSILNYVFHVGPISQGGHCF